MNIPVNRNEPFSYPVTGEKNQLPRLIAVVWLERAKRYDVNCAKHWTPCASRMTMTPPAKRQPGVLRPRLLSCPTAESG